MASMTKCKIHGLQKSYLVTTSLYNFIHENLTISGVQEIVLRQDDLKIAIFIDSPTLEKIPLNKEKELVIGDIDNSPILNELNPIPVCIKCFENSIQLGIKIEDEN